MAYRPLGRVRTGLLAAWGLARGRLRKRPFILSHLVTARCNARCLTCLWRQEGGPELPTASVIRLYREAAGAGFIQVVVWGGEPLLREDLPLLLREAREAGLVVVLITNGWLLEERWMEIRGLVDALILSLDDVGGAHDHQRDLPGLYGRLETAVERLRGDPLRPRLLVNVVLSRLNRGALRRVASVARRWQAGIYFCPMETGEMTRAGFDGRKQDLALPAAELREAAGLARLLQLEGYPFLSTGRYLKQLQDDPALARYVCHVPQAVLTVNSDGGIRDCVRRDEPIVMLPDLWRKGVGLEAVYELPRYLEMVREAASCTVCNNPDVLEISWLWELNLGMLERMARLVVL